MSVDKCKECGDPVSGLGVQGDMCQACWMHFNSAKTPKQHEAYLVKLEAKKKKMEETKSKS